MKILLEADIFQRVSNYNRSDLNKASGDARTDLIIDLLKQSYGENDYIKYINTANKDTNILDIVVKSINDQGSDTNNNKILFLIDEIINSNKEPLPREGFQLASQILQNNKIDFEENANWLLNKDSYNPLYKAKALAFLNTSDANKFGDNIEEAIRDISEMSDENEIKNYLSNWQTKPGAESSKNDRQGNDYLLDHLKLFSFKSTAGPIPELKKYIKSTEAYKNLKNKSIIDNYMDDNEDNLEKLLNNKYPDKQAFNSAINNFIKEYSE